MALPGVCRPAHDVSSPLAIAARGKQPFYEGGVSVWKAAEQGISDWFDKHHVSRLLPSQPSAHHR